MSESPRARLGRLRLADLKAMTPRPAETLREHLEAIRNPPPAASARHLIKEMREHAVEALAILDAAERDMFDHETGMIRIVPDYRPGVDQPHHAPGWTDPKPSA